MLAVLRRLLAFIGRHGTVAFALSVFCGLALPGLASAMRPALTITAFLFILLSIARTDVDNLVATLQRPGRLVLVLLWASLVPPLALWLLIGALPAGTIPPDLLLGMAIYAAAPPLMAAPAYAALLGFRNGLTTAILVPALAASPLVTPPLVSLLVGREVPFDVWEMVERLAWLVGGAMVAGAALYRLAGPARLAAVRHEIAGFQVLLFFCFAIAAMDGVIAATVLDPWRTALFVAVAFAMCLAGVASTLTGLGSLGANDAFTLAIATGFRNMGTAIAVLGVATPADTYLFFSMMQFPIYTAPLMMAAVAPWYRPKA